MQPKKTRRTKPKTGQSLAEYALIITLVVVFCIGALSLLGEEMSTLYNNMASDIGNAIGGS